MKNSNWKKKKKKNFQISSFIEKGCEMFVIWSDFNFWRENSYLLEREKEKDFNKVHLLFNCTHLPLFISFILFLHLFHTNTHFFLLNFFLSFSNNHSPLFSETFLVGYILTLYRLIDFK